MEPTLPFFCSFSFSGNCGFSDTRLSTFHSNHGMFIILLLYSATYFHENEGTLPSVFLDQCHPKLVKRREEKQMKTQTASFKPFSQEVRLKIFFLRHFYFQMGKRKVELNSFIHVKEYKVRCHLLMPQRICHWEAHSIVLSK